MKGVYVVGVTGVKMNITDLISLFSFLVGFCGLSMIIGSLHPTDMVLLIY